MALTRWSVRSLRRFGDPEILANFYLAAGGVFSLCYMVFGILRTKLYLHIFSLEGLQVNARGLQIGLEMMLWAIARAALWLPEMIYAMAVQHQSLWDWITAAYILKDLS